MDHETQDYATCSACDLGAHLQGELDQAKAAQRFQEHRFRSLAAAIADGAQEVPFAALRELIDARQRVIALEQVLAGVLGNHELGGCHAASA